MREYDSSNNTNYFGEYFVDVEYNRMGSGDLKHYENCEHRPKYMISDLLIQSRGCERNLLAVEMKRKGNNKNVKADKGRFISLVSSDENYSSIRCVHDTLVGAFIIYSKDGVQIMIYENVDGKGMHTKCIDKSLGQLTGKIK